MDQVRPYVLVVDNLRDAADSMAELLAAWGYDPEAKYSGAAALVAVHARVPSAVILDIRMDPMERIAFAAQLRQLPACSGTMVIAISGDTIEMHKVGEPGSGIDHHLSKPANLSLLWGVLRRVRDAESEPEHLPLPIPVRVNGTAHPARGRRPAQFSNQYSSGRGNEAATKNSDGGYVFAEVR